MTFRYVMILLFVIVYHIKCISQIRLDSMMEESIDTCETEYFAYIQQVKSRLNQLIDSDKTYKSLAIAIADSEYEKAVLNRNKRITNYELMQENQKKLKSRRKLFSYIIHGSTMAITSITLISGFNKEVPYIGLGVNGLSLILGRIFLNNKSLMPNYTPPKSAKIQYEDFYQYQRPVLSQNHLLIDIKSKLINIHEAYAEIDAILNSQKKSIDDSQYIVEAIHLCDMILIPTIQSLRSSLTSLENKFLEETYMDEVIDANLHSQETIAEWLQDRSYYLDAAKLLTKQK